MAPVVVVAGATLPEALWFADSLDLADARVVSMGLAGIGALDVSAVIVTPSLALAHAGVLGETKQTVARRLVGSLHRSLVRNVGARVRATSLHPHIKRDHALPEGFYYLPLTETAEPEFAPTHRTVESFYGSDGEDAPTWRKVTEHFEAPKGAAPQVGAITFVSSGPAVTDAADVARHLRDLDRSARAQGSDRLGR